METFTVDYFIKKFEAIPDKLWARGDILSQTEAKCALRHCMNVIDIEQLYYNPVNTEVKALSLLIDPSGSKNMHGYDVNKVWKINDGADKMYQQRTPKQRILAALYDIKKMQNAAPKSEQKQITELPNKPMEFLTYNQMKEKEELLFQN